THKHGNKIRNRHMMEWFLHHEAVLLWIAIFSVLSLLASLIVGPWWIMRLPVDYFATPKTVPESVIHDRNIGILFLLLKNSLGIVLIIMGILMLILPGQGMLTMLAGMMLTNFPGKHRLVRWIVMRPDVLRSINWIRRRGNKKPLVIH